MAFQFATKIAELIKAGTMRVVLDEKPLLLAYHKDDVYALSDKCPHMKHSLYEGTYGDGSVTCKRHGATVDVTTGEIKAKAKLLFMKMPTKKAQTYVTKVVDDDVFVLM